MAVELPVHPSNRRLANNQRAVQSKMLGPFVPPRMEKPHDPVGLRLDARQVGAFHQVAIGTGQGQVLRIVSATMLARDDVLDMKAQFGKLLREVAVLAKTAGPAPNQRAQRRVHQAAFGCCRNARASAFKRLRMELARTNDSNSARSSALSAPSVFLPANSS